MSRRAADEPATVLREPAQPASWAGVAVYNDDVLRHHRSFIARRRALRPGVEVPRAAWLTVELLCFLACALVVGYGLYLIVAQ